MNKNKLFYISLLLANIFMYNGLAQSDSLNTEAKDKKIEMAYRSQDPSQITSAVATVSGSELAKSSATNLGNTLYGKLPGLFVIQGTGEPGYDNPWLRVRGSNSDPLIIVDGFERDLSFISPEEIESVSLLKDASAVTLYGMRGANGVLVITTKRGTNQKTKISFTGQTGIQQPTRTINVLGAKDFMTKYNEAAINDGLNAEYTQADIDAAGTSPRYPDVNWKNEVLRKFTTVSKANLGVQGGSEFIKYFVNFGYLFNNGLYKPENPDMKSNANTNRLSIRSNFDVKVTKTTTFSMDLSGSLLNRDFPASNSTDIWNSIYNLPPNAFNIKNPDGNYGGSSLYLMKNPVGILETYGNNNSVDQFLNAGFRIRQNLDVFLKGLGANVGYVIDNGTSNSEGNYRYFKVSQIAPGTDDNYSYFFYGDNSKYYFWSNAASRRFSTWDAALTYDLPASDKHQLNIIARVQQDQQWKANSDLNPYLAQNAGASLHYGYNSKYLIDLSASYYGSDQYSKVDRYGFFPSGSIGWTFSNESFLKDNKVLTYGKLRASYGISAINPFKNGRYAFIQYYENGGSFPLGTDWSVKTGEKPDMLANPNIKWETSEMLNVGLELKFLNVFSINSDFYVDKRSDVLYIDYTRPSVSGADLPYENIGKITNTGFDAKLSYTKDKGAFKWNADLVFSYYKNTVDEMGESMNSTLPYLNRTGDPLNTIYGYEVIGTFQSDADVLASPVQTFGPTKTGDLKYKDLNNDNVIDSRDITRIGNTNANMDLGLRIDLAYKAFDLEMMFQGQFNRDVNLAGNSLYNPFVYGNSVTEIANESDFPRLSLTNMNNYQTSSYWVRSVDFVKLRNLEAGYTFRMGSAKSLRFFLRGMNILTLSGWKYTDPEMTWIGYAPMKTYYIGANITF